MFFIDDSGLHGTSISSTRSRRGSARDGRLDFLATVPFEANPHYDATWRANLLLEQRDGASLRELAERHAPRSKSQIGRDLILASDEAAAAERERVESAKTQSVERDRPAASVWLVDHGAGAIVHPDGQIVQSRPHLRRKSRAPVEGAPLSEVAEWNRQLEAGAVAANRRARLSDAGFARYVTPISAGSYDPRIASEIERVRGIIKDDVLRDLLDDGVDPFVAEAAADERAAEWKPAKV
jgi:hypothetical protein